MKSNTRFVLYSVILVLAISTLANLISELVRRSDSDVSLVLTTTFLISICLFIAMLNYEPARTPRQLDLALIKKLKESWIQSLLDIERRERINSLAFNGSKNTASVKRDTHDGIKVQEAVPPIVMAFEQADRSLLIVGNPGGGKTITLLELARSLLERATLDTKQAIPVVFNLSNFKGGRLEKWLVEELKTRYDVAEDTGRKWLLQRRLILLLDGLDETASTSNCVRAINKFLELQTKTGIVVTANSETESVPLLKGSVSLRPPNGEASKDLELIDKRFDDAEHMEPGFDSIKVIKWLHWLAKRSIDLRQSQFTVAQIQPSWLEGWLPGFLYITFSRLAGTAVVMGIGAGLLGLSTLVVRWVLKNPSAEIPGLFNIEGHLGWWLLVTIGVGGVTIAALDTIHVKYNVRRQDQSASRGAQIWSNVQFLSLYLAVCFIMFFLTSMRVGIGSAVRGATIFAVAYGVVFWFRGRERNPENDTNTADKLVWSRSRIFEGWGWGLLGGIICGLLFALVLKRGVDANLKIQMATLLILIGSMVGVIAGGLRKVSIVENTSPTQGMKMSVRSALLIWLSVAAPSILLIWGFAALIMEQPEPALGGGLFYGMVLGLVCGFAYSGFDIVYRFVFRVIVWAKGYAPMLVWVQFLDYAVDLGFLRKVGGGYVFSQTSLRKCFAEEMPTLVALRSEREPSKLIRSSLATAETTEPS